MPNTYSFMAQRRNPKGAPDYFPTPPWAVRALFECVLTRKEQRALADQSALDPCSDKLHMVRVLKEYFGDVRHSDAFDYGTGAPLRDFLTWQYKTRSVDWLVANPPFSHAEAFVRQALPLARVGVAILARTSFIEGVGRYERLFQPNPVTIFAPFVERVPMTKGRLDPHASTATAYAWFIWVRGYAPEPVALIPPCRRQLERPGDYRTPRPLPARAAA